MVEIDEITPSNREPVKNADLWQRLDAAMAPHQVEWHWVKGHAGHPENERADKLAVKGAQEALAHYQEAIRLKPDYADAHYNLAIVCEKMNAESEARDHWSVYLKLEPSGRYAEYARGRLA